MKHVVIIGGGAAGLLAAYALNGRADEVTIIDKNKILAKKLRITGKGRCNITNAADGDEMLDSITRNKRFMYSAFSKFSNYDIMALMEDLGVSVKVERGGRVFPQSDNAHDVANALIKASADYAKVICGKVTEILTENDTVSGVICNGRVIKCNSVIVATGGMSYPATGSDGFGYTLAKALGHTVVQPRASLVPLVTEEKWVKDLMGLSLKNVKLHVYDGKKEVFSDFGEMLFTHYGISGPIVLSASAHLDNIDRESYTAKTDLKPALDEKQLTERINRDFAEAGKKHLINSLDKLLPKALIPVIIREADVNPHKEVCSITREERQRLLETIKGLTLTVKGTRPIEEAIITRGGVSCNEINPSTMESKLIKGLYFAGEVIDVDAYTGGYNLQVAFSTGYLAGSNA